MDMNTGRRRGILTSPSKFIQVSEALLWVMEKSNRGLISKRLRLEPKVT